MNSELPEAPDFDLGPLISLPNDFLKSEDSTKRAANAFILSLACIFNDLKGVMWFAEQHIKWKPSDGTATGYNGQIFAMNIQIERMAVGMIHELMVVLRDSATELSHPDVVAAISKLSKQQSEAWLTLLSVVQKTDQGAAVKGPTMANFLRIVRNTTAYHYDRSYIMDGYEKWLDDAKTHPNDGNKYAYVSLGDSAEKTRFYFADAPTTFLYSSELINRCYKSNELRTFVSAVNKSLRFLIANYIFPNENSPEGMISPAT
jgi:hypothetical protein